MAKKNNKVPEKMCETCEHFIPIGEGDHLCVFSMPIAVMEDYTPTDEYYWCNGKHWEEM